ncbi:HlyD family secretion protein [Chitinophaga caseinilytica]|uniref:HlyD family efflux transporter periplasmic adaptor subunit n=1 Tax=Chitinophaga caseinilytica TaxID=2267521 RepID=A0ABZ2Z5N2_9BACT
MNTQPHPSATEKDTGQEPIVPGPEQIAVSPQVPHKFMRSDAMEEIFSSKPGWMERRALWFYTGILAAILVTAWFIRYPDIIDASGTLTAYNAPKELLPYESGRIIRLFAQNNSRVPAGATIAWLQSTADHATVLRLREIVQKSTELAMAGNGESSLRAIPTGMEHLGELQQNYRELMQTVQQYRGYLNEGFYMRKNAVLKRDMERLQLELATIRKQQLISQQDLTIARERYQVQEKLLKEKVTSNDEFRNHHSNYLSKEIAANQYDLSILSAETRLSEKRQEVDALAQDLERNASAYLHLLEVLGSKIEDWRKRYTIIAPVEGEIAFVMPLQENQYVTQGKVLGYVSPAGNTQYIEVNLAQENFGKIDTGMQVLLQFQAYPFHEFGHVPGRVSYISSVPSDSGFLASIRLEQGLLTNRNQQLPYKNGLRVKARIITRNLRLLERFADNFTKSFNSMQ